MRQYLARTRALAPSDQSRAMAAVALSVATAYLLWRATTLGGGTTLLVSIPLFIAETSAVAHLGLIWFQTGVPAPRPVTAVAPSDRSFDIVVVALGADVAEVERTLVGCNALRGTHRVHVVDGPHRVRIRQLARSTSASYTPGFRSGVDGLADRLAADDCAELVVWLDGGDVPMPGLLEAASPYFADDATAVVQIGLDLLNTDSLAHNTGGRDQQAFIREVVGPATGHRGLGPWMGSGSIVRRQALAAVGGLDPADGSPRQEALLRLHRAGWTSRFDERPLARTSAPDRLSEYLDDRRERTRDALAFLTSRGGPLRARTLPATARCAHLARALARGAGIRQLVYVVVLATTLLTGILPFDADIRLITPLWAVAVGLQADARHRLARGTMARGDWLRQGWRTLGADLSAVATRMGYRTETPGVGREHGLRALGRLRLLTAAVVLLDLALVARAATIIDNDLLPAFAASERILVLLIGILTLAPMVDVLQVQVRRRQRRAEPRRQAVLPIAVAGQQVETLDITPMGVGLRADHSPPVGSRTPFRLRLPRPDGDPVTVDGIAVVRAATTLGDGRLRVGLEFADLDRTTRAALIRYCAVDHALLADIDRTIPERCPGDLEVPQSLTRRVALRALTAVAVLLSLVTVGVGPAADRASAAETKLVVCLVDSGGGPIAGAAVDRQVDGASVAVGTTGADGCVEGESPSAAVIVSVTHAGVTATKSQNLAADPIVTFSTRSVTVRLRRTSGHPIAGAQVRTFVDGWHSAGTTGADGNAVFEQLPADIDYEVSYEGARFVQFRPVDADPYVVFTTTRLVADPGVTVALVDLGSGWRPFVDGMEVLPGSYSFRMPGGSVVKLTGTSGHRLSVPSGVSTEIVPEITDVAPTTTAPPSSTTTTTLAPEPSVTDSPTTSVTPTTTTAPATTPTTTTGAPTTTVAPTSVPSTSVPADTVAP